MQRSAPFVALQAALLLLQTGDAIDRRRAMVAVEFRKVAPLHLRYFSYRHKNDDYDPVYAVTRTANGKLAVYDFPLDPRAARVGLARLTGSDSWNARLVPGNTGNTGNNTPRPLRTFASPAAAVSFMSGHGRAYLARVRTVGMADVVHRRSAAAASSPTNDKKRAAATMIQSAFRGWTSRRTTYAPPSNANPRGGVAYQAAARRFRNTARA